MNFNAHVLCAIIHCWQKNFKHKEIENNSVCENWFTLSKKLSNRKEGIKHLKSVQQLPKKLKERS